MKTTIFILAAAFLYFFHLEHVYRLTREIEVLKKSYAAQAAYETDWKDYFQKELVLKEQRVVMYSNMVDLVLYKYRQDVDAHRESVCPTGKVEIQGQ